MLDEDASRDGGDASRRNFIVTAHGMNGEPPFDLDAAELESLESAAWVGASERFEAEDGIVRIVGEQSVAWEVVAPISVTPKVLAPVPGKVDHRGRREFYAGGKELMSRSVIQLEEFPRETRRSGCPCWGGRKVSRMRRR